MTKRFGQAVKEEVLGKIRNGRRVSEVAQEHGIHEQTVRNWLERDTAAGASEILETSRLRRENEAPWPWSTPTFLPYVSNFDVAARDRPHRMRLRRMFQSSSVYEICFRAKRGLPLPTRRLIKLVIDSALARTQRDGGKVTICDHVWMANHVHLLVVSGDIAELKNFYGELKKRITDIIKRLLGMEELTLWENKEAPSTSVTFRLA